MLSDQEKKNCRTILELLSDDDIFTLMNTSTNRSISTRNAREAITAILEFTQSLDEFFKRRKISKDLLLKYIYQHSWPVPRDSDLKAIKDYIISQWERAGRSTSVARREEPSLQRAEQPRAAFTQINKTYNNKNTYNNVTNYVVNVQLPTSSTLTVTDGKIEEHQNAVSFVKWFYNLLNSCNPDLNQSRGDFGPHHFWRDAQMRLEMTVSGQPVSETLTGGEAIARKMLSFSMGDRLLFSPSDSEAGLKIRSDPFGRKVIMVCGLVHKGGVCVGSFWQTFGLVCDPAMNKAFKVRVTLLKMIENNSQSMPSLTYDDDASVMENLTVSAIAEAPQ